MKLILLIVLIALSEAARSNRKRREGHPSKHWGYRNQDRSLLPTNWHDSHPKCYGQQQSPINVETVNTVYDKDLTELNIEAKYANETEELWEVKNNGHSIVMYAKNSEFYFKSRPDNSKYKFLQMHFHWRGSEHFVDGHRFAGELHLVHQNVENPEKFSVIGFLLGQTNHDNKNLLPITNVLDNIIKYNSNVTISNFKLNDLIPFDLEKYYRYSGSLTTPACDEIVEWHLIENPVLEISDEQILDFQSIEDNHGFQIITNSRPIQELNDRQVKRSFEAKNLGMKRKHLKSASGLTDSVERVEASATSTGARSSASIYTLILFLIITRIFNIKLF